MTKPQHGPQSPRSRRRRWQLGLFLLGTLLILFIAALRAWPAPITALDLEQTRLDVALPPLPTETPFVQTFRPDHDGLVEIELLLARVREGQDGSITLRLHDEQGQLVAARTWPVAALEHNQPLVLRFPPQPASAGHTYALSLGGTGGNPFSFWGYRLDLHSGGNLIAPGTAARELRFVTRYRLLPLNALRQLAARLWVNVPWLLLALALLFMPGTLLLLLVAPRWDQAAWWGVALALTLALWPLLWYWLTVAGGRWRAWSLAAVLLGGGLAILLLWLRRRPRHRPTIAPAHLLLLALLLLAFAVRLLAVRDLLFLPWVDSTRHALITRIMATSGQVVRDYRPLLPIDRFPYHFGFHTLSAALFMLGGTTLPNLLLILGQFLNALVPLTIYAAAWLVTRRYVAAFTAAFLVAFPFFFPAYYVSWGRLTQLTGVLLLPVLLALTWLVAAARPPQPPWWLVALLAAGLALIHFRVFLLYLPFAAIAWLVGRGRGTRALATAALLALLLVGPRLWELLQTGTGVFSGAGTTYNDFPFGYVMVGWEREFLVAAVIALLLAIRPALLARPWALFTLTLAAWSATVLLFLSYTPTIWLINLNSAYIVFFVPLALILGVVGAALEAWWRRFNVVGAVAYVLSGALFALLLLHGLRQQTDVLNPTTRLARPADLPAITWVDHNLPSDAVIAVNSWQWLGAAWAGSDGGAWLLPLTGRQTTTPPADYVYSREIARQVVAFNEAAQEVEDWSDPVAARWLADQGVTHIFVGARGGFFDPAELARNPVLTPLYADEGVFVFALNPSP